MKHTLVKPDGTLGDSRDFAVTPPTLAAVKGKWLPDNPPAHNPLTHSCVRSATQSVDNASIVYLVTPLPVEQVRTRKKQEVDAAYAAAIQQPVTYNGNTFDADANSQNILMATLTALSAVSGPPTGFYWKAEDNSKVPMTAAQLQGLAQAMFAQGWAAFQKRDALKAQIDAAQTVEAVDAVAW